MYLAKNAAPPAALPPNHEACEDMRPNDTIRRLLRTLLLGCFALLLASSAYGQTEQTPELTPEEIEDLYPAYRAHGTWFVRFAAGPNFYGGDRDVNVGNSFQSYVESIGLTLLPEVGYSFTNRFSLSLQYYLSRYPRIEDIVGEDGPFDQPAYGSSTGDTLNPATTSKTRHHIALVGRSYVWPERRFTPYGHYGFHLSFGKINDDLRMAAGPMAGIGFDVYSTPRIGIFVELNGVFAFNDRALDLADTRSKQTPDTPEGIDASDFDAFTHFLAGIRFNFDRPEPPPLGIDCFFNPMQDPPLTLAMNEEATFTASVTGPDAPPGKSYTYSWNFGERGAPDVTRDDQGQPLGPLASHRYSSPGTYNVVITVTDWLGRSRSSDPEDCPVVIPQRLSCDRIAAVPASLDMCELPLPEVQFQSSVSGGVAPFTYRWNFGDGGTSTQAEPVHQYVRTDAEPITLTRNVTLTVTDAIGQTAGGDPQCSIDFEITSCQRVCPYTGQGPEPYFFTVNFNRNESVLTDVARRGLRDNANYFLDNPQGFIYVTGYAQPGERDAQELADDRARAIMQYYLEYRRDGIGIDPSRILFLPHPDRLTPEMQARGRATGGIVIDRTGLRKDKGGAEATTEC